MRLRSALHRATLNQALGRALYRASRRGFATIGAFERRAAAYWTSDRVEWLTNGQQDTALSPDKPGVVSLLRVLGLLNSDGSISDGSLRKYKQLAAMHEVMETALKPSLQAGGGPLRVMDMCTGASSHLALLLAFASRWRWERPVHVIAVDASPARLAAAEQRAALLGFGPDVLHFRTSAIRDLPDWPDLYGGAFASAVSSSTTPHGVFALHACDTATDEAAAYAVRARTESLQIAPCCQAELAQSWRALAAPEEVTMRGGGGVAARRAAAVASELRKARAADASHHGDVHAFGPIHRSPALRREVASSVTDTMRVLLLRASGYTVKVREFVSTEHSHKNKLISAARQRPARGAAGRVHASAEQARAQAWAEYHALQKATGGVGVSLADMLGMET